MIAEKTAIAVPTYEQYMGIKGPYFGDMVFEHLENDHPGKYERIYMTVKAASDGSEEIVTDAHMRERDVYVMHPQVLSPAQHVMTAQEMSDDLIRSDAQQVILFDLYNPYYSYDKRKGKQSINARTVADNYKAAGINRVFTVDPHSDLLVLAFGPECPLEPLSMQGPLAERFRESYELGGVTVCSPDIGGYPRAEVFADMLDIPLVGIRKRRSEHDSDSTKALEIVGDKKHIKGRKILFRDDVIRSGGSLLEAKNVLDEAGAEGYYAVATHLSLCGDARKRIKESGIKVIGTNTVPQKFAEDERSLYDVLDISPIIAKIMYRRSEGMSISEFFRSSFGERK